MNKVDSEKVTEHIPTHKTLGFKKFFFFLQLQYFQYYQMTVLYHFKDEVLEKHWSEVWIFDNITWDLRSDTYKHTSYSHLNYCIENGSSGLFLVY